MSSPKTGAKAPRTKPSITLRNFSSPLHHEIRIMALLNNTTVTRVVEHAVTAFLKQRQRPRRKSR